ncbi:hypothetical protein J4230_04080 [Candidatus Woesearchaeota archaeon]|nr:hypothetical protein [Candidatus Woesearchaeota archaeon]
MTDYKTGTLGYAHLVGKYILPIVADHGLTKEEAPHAVDFLHRVALNMVYCSSDPMRSTDDIGNALTNYYGGQENVSGSQ